MSNNREKDALLSKARHNLKNPVNAILGFSEMLIEDCEDEGYDSIIPDLEKIHNAGKNILSIIESSFSDSNLKNSGDKISEIASEMEISLRTPINTVIGYSEMLQEDTEDIDLDTFSEDLEKIIKSGRALTEEIDNVISFNPTEFDQNEDKSISAIKSVLSSIQPLSEDEDTRTTNGSILVVDDNKNNTTRFLVMEKKPKFLIKQQKKVITSILFQVRNIPASLYKAMGGFATNNVNMIKLESYMLGGSFEATQFFADIQGHPEDRSVKRALDELRYFTSRLDVIGVYKQSTFRDKYS